MDLEITQERLKLADARAFLKEFEDRLVILDEIHRVPQLFATREA